jgi:hypothetical protein
MPEVTSHILDGSLLANSKPFVWGLGGSVGISAYSSRGMLPALLLWALAYGKREREG